MEILQICIANSSESLSENSDMTVTSIFCNGQLFVNAYDASGVEFFDTNPEKTTEAITGIGKVLTNIAEQAQHLGSKTFEIYASSGIFQPDRDDLIHTYAYDDSVYQSVLDAIDAVKTLLLDPNLNFWENLANMLQSTDGLSIEDCTLILLDTTPSLATTSKVRI